MTRSTASKIAAAVFVTAGALLISGWGSIPPGFLWAMIGTGAIGTLLARYGS